MRRLTVELFGPELERRLRKSPSFRRVRDMEVLRVLRYDAKEVALVCRVVMKNPQKDVKGDVKKTFETGPIPTKVEFLGEVMDERGRSSHDSGSIVLVRRALRQRFLFGPESIGRGYLQPPLGLRNGRLTFTVVGTQAQLRSILNGVERRKIYYRVLSLVDARFGSDSLLRRLTEKQQEVLQAAYRQGYYDVPRKVTSKDLARSLRLTDSTVVEHLRKAERRLLLQILGERPVDPSSLSSTP